MSVLRKIVFSSKPLVRMLFSSVLFSLLVIFGLSLFHAKPLPGFDLFIGAIGAFVGKAFFDLELSPKERRDEFIRLFFSNSRTIINVSLWYGFLFYFLSHAAEPKVLQVAEVFTLFKQLGLVACIMVMAYLPIFNAISCRENKLTDMAIFAAKLVVSYNGISWLVGNFGDVFYLWCINNVEDAVVITCVILLTYIMFRFSVSNRVDVYKYDERQERSSTGYCHPSSLSSIVTTDHDLRVAAAHEAGHALVYAALAYLPNDVKININKEYEYDGVIGYVTGVKCRNTLLSEGFAEWSMMTLLAGRQSENFLMGEMSIGSKTDLTKWTRLAQMYLAGHVQGVYYVEPHNEYELKSNNEKINELQLKQIKLLQELFVANKVILKEMTSELIEKKSMDRTRLLHYLQKVDLPRDFPCLSGHF